MCCVVAFVSPAQTPPEKIKTNVNAWNAVLLHDAHTHARALTRARTKVVFDEALNRLYFGSSACVCVRARAHICCFLHN